VTGTGTARKQPTLYAALRTPRGPPSSPNWPVGRSAPTTDMFRYSAASLIPITR
jgi:hypothetical protein